MAEVGRLPPAYRIPPSQPSAGTGQGSEAPRRKPKTDDRQREKQRQRKKDGDDASHIDEYA